MLKDYLWEIFLCAEEERNDGDNFNPDVTSAANVFVAHVTGNPEHQYECLSNMDTSTAKAKWEAMDAESRSKEYVEVGEFCNKHFNALCAAFNDRDREKFMAIVNG